MYLEAMAKSAKKNRGRPTITPDTTLDLRLPMMRIDQETHAALERYASLNGLATTSAAVRSLVIKGLRSEGLLK